MKFLLSLVFIAATLCAVITAKDEYIQLPGKSCTDAPDCPDDRPCVMASPRKNCDSCVTELVPTCGKKP
ncbi:PREDICTED: uncharacterized protein LOC108573855 [Habropoda laboriosa]|nr:PREDICTED: uncharacterized protein LOC108573855 [Habropoda laboriosa]